VRDPAWQRVFLAKPLEERRAIARQYRADSRDAQTGKAMAILDVNPGAVIQVLRDSGCSRLIHGHTHRPARHVLEMDGDDRERWVLPDWYETGGGLSCDATGCRPVYIRP
jgi:UDP-2,3-diacylglucosamine hydrolase